jgi:membrane protease YdiL (CAAX protease family)
LFVGQAVVFRTEPRRIPTALGLGLPAGRAVVVALLVGGLVIDTFLVGAALLGIQLRLRPEWPAVLLAALIFHGVAEELVWRGYTFARIREHFTFWRAVLLSIPLIAATHVPIILTNGWLVGGLALVSAAVTCLPLAYLWERGGRTIWPPAIVHGLIGSWQIFDRSYPMTFSLVVLMASILVPLIAFAFRDNFFGAPRSDREHPAAR